MPATFQAEFDRARMSGAGEIGFHDWHVARTMSEIARAIVDDTIKNAGTFVLVVTGDKVTMVQRSEAEDADAPPNEEAA